MESQFWQDKVTMGRPECAWSTWLVWTMTHHTFYDLWEYKTILLLKVSTLNRIVLKVNSFDNNLWPQINNLRETLIDVSKVERSFQLEPKKTSLVSFPDPKLGKHVMHDQKWRSIWGHNTQFCKLLTEIKAPSTNHDFKMYIKRIKCRQ